MNDTIKIALAEDHVFVRQGMMALLASVKNIEVLFDVGNGLELLEKLNTYQPDIILLDIDMPVMNGREAIVQVKNRYPEIRVIMLSMHFTDEIVLEFVTLGAKAFLNKQVDISGILAAIFGVYETGYYYDTTVTNILARSFQVNSKAIEKNIVHVNLTIREQQVFELLKESLSTNEIAEKLVLSSRTVEGHRQRLLKKTGVSSVDELLRLEIHVSLVV